MTIKLLDVSHWNDPDWPDWFSQGFVGSYIKATEGTTWIDPMFVAHTFDAQDAGFVTGAYHYFRVQWNGAAQAEHFFGVAGNQQLPPAVDVERINNGGYSKSVFAARVRNFLLRAEELFGRKPIIYTSYYAWKDLIGSASWSRDYELWVANYTSNASPLIPNDWDIWRLWQHTSNPLDQNRFNGSNSDWLIWAGLAEPPATVTVELPIDTYNAIRDAFCV